MPQRRASAFLVAATACAAAFAAVAQPATAVEPPSAVIFAYNRVGEDESPNSSIRTEQFDAHLDDLRNGGYAVLPLPRIIDALRAGKPLPDRTVAITIDEASRSLYREAWPRLRASGLPFTLFVATDAIDRGSPAHMTWDEVRELAASGVTIGGLGASTMSLASRPAADVRAELRRMSDRLQAELRQRPTLFAYPAGEYSTATRALLAEAGFAVAFGSQSGVAYAGADLGALPRFVMNEAFGSIERFRIAASALALPVSDMTPEDPLLSVNPPPLGFTVDDGVAGDLSKLACFAAGQGRTALEWIAADRVEVRITAPFPPGRTRINCTLPTPDGRWRWHGMQFLVPD